MLEARFVLFFFRFFRSIPSYPDLKTAGAFVDVVVDVVDVDVVVVVVVVVVSATRMAHPHQQQQWRRRRAGQPTDPHRIRRWTLLYSTITHTTDNKVYVSRPQR